jgi:hypothetical protein
MIPERAAAYVLAVVCVFQALRPSTMINAQYWRSIDIRIGWLRVQARNCSDSAYFDGLAGKKDESSCSSEGRISLLHIRPSHHRRLTICMSDTGCMTAWLDGISHVWPISKDR